MAEKSLGNHTWAIYPAQAPYNKTHLIFGAKDVAEIYEEGDTVKVLDSVNKRYDTLLIEGVNEQDGETLLLVKKLDIKNVN